MDSQTDLEMSNRLERVRNKLADAEWWLNRIISMQSPPREMTGDAQREKSERYSDKQNLKGKEVSNMEDQNTMAGSTEAPKEETQESTQATESTPESVGETTGEVEAPKADGEETQA